MKQTKQNGNGSRAVWMAMAVLLAIGAVSCLAAIFYSGRHRAAAEDTYAQMQDRTTEDAGAGQEAMSDILAGQEIELPEKSIDFDMLREENEDIYAWVYVPGTEVDYPVLRHPTDDSYYLNHNLDGSSGYPGCIYSESLNAKDFTDNHTVLYGHNMDDGSMFGSLHTFEDESFFAEDHYIYVYTPEKLFIFQVFAAYEYPAIHLLYNFDMEDDEFFGEYLAGLKEMHGEAAQIRRDMELTADDRILTLSTCTSDHEDTLRFLVQGVLVYEEQ